MQMNNKCNNSQLIAEISPSLICADLCNLERDVKRIEALGCSRLHIDVLDGHFSPSMPIGLGTVRQLRAKTSLAFDAHVMATANEFFVNELIDIGVERLCFQIEHEPTPGPLLQKIRNYGVKPGIALSPTTPVSMLEYIIEDCDFVLLMQIDPGYASLPGTQKKNYMHRKITDLNEMIQKYNPKAIIGVDGRVSIDEMPELLRCGVRMFVSGTSGFFNKNASWEENWSRMTEVLRIAGETTNE